MLARHNEGRPLELVISSTTALVTCGPFRWELADRPYAVLAGETSDQAQAAMLLRVLADPEPWPEDMAPLVEDLVSIGRDAQSSPFRREASDERSSLIETIESAMGDDLSEWSTAKLRRVAAAIRRGP